MAYKACAVDELNQEFLRLLTSSGWKKARAAAELHVDPSAVTRYVNGEARPSLTVLRLFAEIIGERLLVGSADDVPTALREGPRHLEAWERDLLDRLRRIEPSRRRPAIEALGQFLDAFAPFPPAEAARSTPSPSVPSPSLSEAPVPPASAPTPGRVRGGRRRVSSATPPLSSEGMEAHALLGAVVAGQHPGGGPPPAPTTALPSGSKRGPGRRVRPASSPASPPAMPAPPAP
jgi:transcriptional regulator with XRE-family HTH domain